YQLTVGDWISIATLLVLLAALIMNWLSTRAATKSANAAITSIKGNRAWITQKDQGEIRRDGKVGFNWINSGGTPATNVRFSALTTKYPYNEQTPIPLDDNFKIKQE